MPFIRSYGLNIGYDSAALLATIAVAYLAVARGSRPKLVLAVLFVIFVVVFQARGMVLQVVLATALIPILRFPRRALFIIPVVVLGLVLISARGSDAGTTISSQARQLTDAQTLDDLKHHPASFLEGRDADAYFRSALASGGSGLVAAFPRSSTLPCAQLLSQQPRERRVRRVPAHQRCVRDDALDRRHPMAARAV